MTVWSAYLSYRMRVQSVTKVLVPHAVTLWKGGVGPGFQQILTSYSEASSRERQSVSGYRLDLLR